MSVVPFYVKSPFVAAAVLAISWWVLSSLALAQSANTGQEKAAATTDVNAPGKMHQRLEQLVGKWRHTVTLIPAPGQPPLTAEAISTNRMIYGGRFLEIDSDVEFMGQTGKSLIIIGHNNSTNKFSFYNIASVSTDVTFARGSWDEDQQMIKLQGENVDPATGKPRAFRIEIALIGKDEYRQHNYFMLPDGSEHRAVSIISRRGGGGD